MRRAQKSTSYALVAVSFVILCIIYLAIAVVFVRVQHIDHPHAGEHHASVAMNIQSKLSSFRRKASVTCDTSKGPFTIALDWETSPKSVAQFVKMVEAGFMQDIAFFRVNKDITQFGVREKHTGLPFKDTNWERDLNSEAIAGNRVPWKRGTFALIGGTQMVIVRRDSQVMGKNNHDTVAGRIGEKDMWVIDSLFAYNDIIDHPQGGPGPDQVKIMQQGWTYLNKEFPQTDRIIKCYF